ncbi:DUF7287 family protein [Halanaeroarchaeum sulfurireducens]|uniref:Uncharacterized protein n=1 Tax=Halanaeroarchaeum sulfurireducens TaxID=1604004 RepID=A0A0F7PE34_9EURY|nr:hypothetical protein [Halanaeroarchaeum sulfurireducens]AKH97598.1 hypothetical protein HLASF_1110 [Halanaeroarchaeum sulfurireducens]ALG81994.1 hypothetical protein HLASA_1099 [Halanaeroarchaeum sulfurireducens]
MRAQTTLDFLVGVSIFLLTVAMVMAMIPGILDPFALEESSSPVQTNRAATALATDELADDGDPYVLSTTKVDAFFVGTDVTDQLGLDEDRATNVTLENESGIVKAIGPPVPQDRSTTTAWRTVSYEGAQATVRVRTW